MGAVYGATCSLSANDAATAPTATVYGATPDAQLGFALASDGGLSAVGSLDGRVHVYTHAANGSLRYMHSLAGSPGAFFGASLALNAGLLAVGAPAATRFDGAITGAVFVYSWDEPSQTFSLLAVLNGTTVFTPAARDIAMGNFGGSALAVLGASQTVVIGAPRDASGMGTVTIVRGVGTAEETSTGPLTRVGGRAGGGYGSFVRLQRLAFWSVDLLVLGEPCTACGAIGLAFAYAKPLETAAWNLASGSQGHALPLDLSACPVASATNSAFGAAAASDSNWLAIAAPRGAVVCIWRMLPTDATPVLRAVKAIGISASPAPVPVSPAFRFGAALAISAGRLAIAIDDASADLPSIGAIQLYTIGLTEVPTSGDAVLRETLSPPGAHAAHARYGWAVAFAADGSVLLSSAPNVSANATAGGGLYAHGLRVCGTGAKAIGLLSTGMLQCATCVAGSVYTGGFAVPTSAGTDCLTCDTGTYQPGAGSTYCVKCPQGTANALRGQAPASACLPCEPGTAHNQTGRSSCPLCPSGTFQNGTGAYNCIACPEGANCAALGTAAPQAKPGYYLDLATGRYIACIDPSSRCAGANLCAKGYANPPSCSECAHSYYVRTDSTSTITAACQKCPKLGGAYALLFVLVVVFVAVMLVKLAKSATVFMTSIGVGLNFLQIVAVLASFNFDWPSGTQRSLNFTTFFNLNLDLFSVDCFTSAGISPTGIMILKMLVPLLFMALFLFMYLAVRCVYCCTSSGGKAKTSEAVLDDGVQKVSIADRATSKHLEKVQASKAWQWAVINASLAMLNLIYISLLLTTLEIYDCSKPDAAGQRRLNSDTSVVCYTPEWYRMRRVSIVCGAIYGLGIPLLFLTLLFRRRNKLHHRAVVLQLGMLFRKYFVSSYLWELVIILRKTIIVSMKLLAAVISEPARLRIIFATVFIFTIAQLIFKPYQSPRANRLEMFTLACVDVIVLLGLYIKGAITSKPSSGVRGLVGNIVVLIVLVALVAIVMAVLSDFRNGRRMKKRGMVGAFATEDVHVFKHFFTSGFFSASENRMITTTDHFSNLLFGYEIDPHRQNPVLVVMVTQQRRVGIARSRRAQFDGSTLVQHDVVGALFHISVLFPRPGSYSIQMSGGRPLEDPKGACTRSLSERNRQARADLWYPGRRLVSYNLIVSEHGAAGPRQEFVRVDRLAERFGILFSPVEAFLNTGEAFFRIRVPHGRQVVVVQGPNSEVQTFLTREKHSDFSGDKRLFQEDTYSGDVHIEHVGALRVLAYIRQDSVEAVMHQASRHHSRGHQMEHIELLVYSVVTASQDIPTPSMNLLEAQRQVRRRRVRAPTATKKERPRSLDLEDRAAGVYNYELDEDAIGPGDVQMQQFESS